MGTKKGENYEKLYGKKRAMNIKKRISETLIAQQPPKDIEYIKEKLKNYTINPNTKCWEWGGATTNFGHGRIKINKKFFSPHRLSYEIHKGLIPKGLFICHHCDNPRCINPEHLFAGTRSDNMKDAFKKGRLNMPNNRGENSYNHKLTEEQVIQILRTNKENPSISNIDLSKRFGVDRRTISNIINNQKWKHIDRTKI